MTRSSRRIAAFFASSALLLFACGGSTNTDLPTGGICAPGATQACVGPGACQGGQACLPSGDGWGPCDCAAGAGGMTGFDAGFSGSSGGVGTGGAAGLGAAGATTGGAGGKGGGTGGTIIIGTGGAGPGLDGGACMPSTQPAKPIATDVFIMQDKSGSMECPASDDTCQNAVAPMPPSRWDAMSAAVNSFINSPSAAGVRVGLGFFPTTAMSCLATSYATPVVPIAPLPGNAMPIGNAIAATMPTGGTPTAPALQGALDYAKAYTMQNMGARTAAVLFVTDGVPTGCNAIGVTQAVAAAEAGFMGTPSIKTFVVGMGDTAALDQVALAGSGGATHYIPTMGDVTGTLLSALGAISNMSTCAYELPTTVDPHLVNVELKLGASAPKIISHVSSSSACMSADGWYYDNPALPTTILLCPSSCDAIKATPGSSLQILYGCPSLSP